MKFPLTFQWSSCKHPRTLSFRAKDNYAIFKTVNSIYLDPLEGGFEGNTPDQSCFTNTSGSMASFSTDSDGFGFFDCGESLEAVVRGVLNSSERLFFEPGDTSSILEKAKTVDFPFKESVVLALESDDPYVEFRKSMEEMVESHGLKDWDCLEELLSWYLRVNGKKNHAVIVEAFVDLLINLTSSNNVNTCCTNESTSYSSAASSFSDSPLCSLKGDHEDEIEEEVEEKLVVAT